MTLFIKMPKRQLEISDAYFMVLGFCLGLAIGLLVKKVLEKQAIHQKIKFPNPKGGSLDVQYTDETELGLTILSCIANSEFYVVRDPKIIDLIFGLVKEKVQDQSLIIAPNMIRFMALKLIGNDKTFVTSFGKIIVSSNNRIRFFSRILGATLLGFAAAIFAIVPYGILIAILYFGATENCGYNCENYFELVPKQETQRIYAEKSFGNLIIGKSENVDMTQIFIPSKPANQVITLSNTAKRTYTNSRTKLKEIKFSDFKKNDLVLSAFKNLQEPDVPQKPCLINDVLNVGIE
jgi:formylmethanofuran dehydrogenase subunit D